MAEERRRTRRLMPKNPMQLFFDCDGEVIGRVYNISEQGVSFEYDSSCRPKFGRELVVKLTHDRQSPHKVEDVRCIPIYDISTLVHDQTFRGANMRLCGLKYVDLSRTQQNKLHRLLVWTI